MIDFAHTTVSTDEDEPVTLAAITVSDPDAGEKGGAPRAIGGRGDFRINGPAKLTPDARRQ